MMAISYLAPKIAQFTKSIKASEVVTKEICEVLHDAILIEMVYGSLRSSCRFLVSHHIMIASFL